MSSESRALCRAQTWCLPALPTGDPLGPRLPLSMWASLELVVPCGASHGRGRGGRSPGGVQQVPGTLKAEFRPSPPPPRSRRPQCLRGCIPAGGRAAAFHTGGWTCERTSLVIGSVQAPVSRAQGFSSHSRADGVDNRALAPISADRKRFTLSEVDGYMSCSGMRSHILERVESEGARG